MKKIEKTSCKAGLLFVIASICLTTVGGSIAVADGARLTAAPLNSAFLAHMSSLQKGMAMLPAYTEDARALGFIPSPLNMEHLKGINVFQQVQAQSGLPASYDLRTQGKLTPVRNQGACGSCWAFATYSSLESTFLPGETDNFSENHLKDTHGFDWSYCAGGNGSISTAYLTRWSGPVYEVDDPYNPSSGTSPSGLSPRKHVQDVYIIPPRGSRSDNDNLKNAVMTYGAVDVSMYWSGSTGSSSTCWNNTTHSYYYSGAGSANHDVAVVGWDDNYSKTNFSTAPPGDGAFIVRNSWGSGWGDAGYFYVSYDDGIFGRSCYSGSCFPSYSFREAEPITNFSRVYQYDPFGWVSSVGYTSADKTTAWFANVFTAVASERLSAVSFYAASPNSAYMIYIYKDITAGIPRSGTLAATQTGTLQLPGYNTIGLSSPVNLTSGEAFSIVVKLTTPGYSYPIPYEFQYPGYTTAATASPGQSFISHDGNSWMDLTSWEATANVCLKGFTGPNSSLYASFAGNGLWQWNGTSWSQVHSLPPTSMTASGSTLYAAWGGGLYAWNGSTWSQVHPLPPTSMVASGSTLYAAWPSGLYAWNGTTWSQVTPNSPTSMVASGSTLYAAWPSGLYAWNGTTWSQVHSLPPTSMTASGSALYATWGAGLWAWSGTAWSEIHSLAPAHMAASGSALYADWTGAGIWAWNGTTWSQLTPTDPIIMAASGSLWYGNFGTGAGIWKWDGTTWSQITPGDPTSMVTN